MHQTFRLSTFDGASRAVTIRGEVETNDANGHETLRDERGQIRAADTGCGWYCYDADIADFVDLAQAPGEAPVRVQLDDRTGTDFSFRYAATIRIGDRVVGVGCDNDALTALRQACREFRLRRRCGNLRSIRQGAWAY